MKPIGGPSVGFFLLLGQALILALLVFNPMLAAASVVAVCATIVVLDKPILGIGCLIIARLLSTGATVFFRIGKIGIGPFEPALILCLIALVISAALSHKQFWVHWPWRTPYIVMMVWVGIAILWSPDPSDGLSVLLPMMIVVANAMVILRFVDTMERFRLMLWFWVAGAVLIGIAAIMVDTMGIQTTEVTFQAASGGGRETGLGQQPNWFAMNLMFIIHSCFGLVLVEKTKLAKLVFGMAGFFVFIMMLKAGSRGSAYATLIGGALAALAQPDFRRWFFRFAFLTAMIFFFGIVFDVADSGKALSRIGSNFALNNNFRQLNWLTCLQMFWDTAGVGIGTGGYEVLLKEYNNYLAQSLYDYPHGIFWQIIAHWGFLGIGIMVWLMTRLVVMARDLVRLTKGTAAEVFAWTMPATMLGYAAWSFLEFTLNDKPFWEFLALYTALYLIAKKANQDQQPLVCWQTATPIAREDQ